MTCTILSEDNSNEEEYEENNFMFHTLNIMHQDIIVDTNKECVSKERNEGYMFKQHDKNESTQNLRKWLLFDTASTMHLICNKNVVKKNSIRPSAKSQGVISNGGGLQVQQEATLGGVGDVPFTEEGITNVLSMAKLVMQGFRIFIDTAIENAIFVYTPDGRIMKFVPSKNGLYFHDTSNWQMTFFNSQYENR